MATTGERGKSAPRPPPILCYHRIADPLPGESPYLAVRPRRFQEQLAFLRRLGFAALTVDGILERMAAGEPFPPKAFTITLDDGYLDNRDHALPVLASLSFAATVYTVTDFVGSTSTFDADVGEPPHPLLGREDLRALCAEGIALGSHSATHRILTRLSDAEILEEARRSRAFLEDIAGSPVSSFSYPRGGLDGRVIAGVRQAGYRGAVTAIPTPGRDPLFELPRLIVYDWDFPLKLWMKMRLRRNYLLGRDLRRLLPPFRRL